MVERAYAQAAGAHDGQFRKSGDAYITHPLAVATIVAELGLDEDTIAAALLHDSVEDTASGIRPPPPALRGAAEPRAGTSPAQAPRTDPPGDGPRP